MRRLAFGLMGILVSVPVYAQAPGLSSVPVPETAVEPREIETPETGPTIVAESACLNRLSEAVPELQRTLGRADRRELRDLRDTAIVLARRGNEDLCQAVVLEIEGIVAEAGSIVVPEPDAATERERLAAAGPMLGTEAIRIEEFIDSEVVGLGGEEIGEIEDIVVMPGERNRIYAVIDRDNGWLRAGSELVTVPLHAFRGMEDDDELVLGVTEDVFDEMPTFSEADLDTGLAYDEVDRYWQERGIE